MPSSRRPSARALLLSAALLGAACARRAPEGSGSGLPPVFVVSVDTLRADRVGAYGSAASATPRIDAFRKDAILFEDAWAQAPLTLPSHASLFTGRLPAGHGIRDNLGYELRADVPTLAELLRARGYATGGAVSAVVLARPAGLERGFDLFDDTIEPSDPLAPPSELQRPGAAACERLERFVSGAGPRPVFGFLHLYEPHSPYEAPEPFRSRHASAYDGEVAAADAVVGRFLDFLKARGLYDRAVVAVVSDHGEGLGDHGEPEHGVFLYRESVHVPLLLKLPLGRRAGETVAEPAALVDLLPTVAELAGFPPPAGVDGRSLLSLGPADGARKVFSETFYPRLHLGWSDLRSLAGAGFHFVDGPAPELFDLKADPGERVNLLPARSPDAYRGFAAEMARLRSSFVPPAAPDAERARALASLGYLTGAPGGGTELPDPKSRIGVLADLARADAAAQSGASAEAASLYRSVLRREPGFLLAYSRLARALLASGRRDEAVSTVKEGLAAAGGTSFLLPAADVLLSAGLLPDAEALARTALTGGDRMAALFLSRVLLASSRPDEAEKLLRERLDAAAFPSAFHLQLARIAAARRDPATALAEVEAARLARAAAGMGPLPGAGSLRAEALLALGRPDEAESPLREEIAAFPRSVEPRVSLAFLQAATGRHDEARSTLRALAEEVGGPAARARAEETLRLIGAAPVQGRHPSADPAAGPERRR